MSLTLLALFLMPLYLRLVLYPKGAHKMLKELTSNDTLRTIFSMHLLLLGIVILAETGFNFAWKWESLLAWLGLLIAIKGALFMIPDFAKWGTKFYKKADMMPFFGFIGLLFALALVYVDTNLL